MLFRAATDLGGCEMVIISSSRDFQVLRDRKLSRGGWGLFQLKCRPRLCYIEGMW